MVKNPGTDWIASGWGCRVTSRDQLLRTIGRIAIHAQGRVYAWRGQSSASWDLSSSLFRHIRQSGKSDITEPDVAAREEAVIREARKYGLGRDLGPSNSNAHLLASLQHHGVPTRLIDVTSNPYTALWFACQPSPREAVGRGVLFAIDVTDFSWAHSFEHDEPSSEHDEPSSEHDVVEPRRASYARLLAKSRITRRPFRLYPAVPDDRMRAQEGYFIGSVVPSELTIPGVPDLDFAKARPPGPEVLDHLVNDPGRGRGRPGSLPFLAIVIDKQVKESMRDPLKGTFNRRRRVLFPDLDGFRDAFNLGELDLDPPVPASNERS